MLLPLTPILMSDVMVLLPALAVYMLGAGPAMAASNREWVCGTCGATWSPPPGRLSALWHALFGPRERPRPEVPPRLTLVKSAPPVRAPSVPPELPGPGG